jgi:hypothetical protein
MEYYFLFRYCKIVKDFLSPMFLVYFLTSEAMMCMAVFQVAMVSKYLLTFILDAKHESRIFLGQICLDMSEF